ncbi:MAG TPA: hypothetical protein VFV38_45775, partial [Ktedonobacteraceae bacterium]|nr:hypothetical protein [Ktedonobacteraceae bacterium]
MVYSRRNNIEEQQEAARQAQSIATLCEQWHLTLDQIDWPQWGMQALVSVNGVEIAPLLDLGRSEGDDLLRLIQLKLLEHAALTNIPARPEAKALMWRPLTLVQPQAFLSLWIITLETDERIPIVESMCNGQRVYECYPFDAQNMQQLARLFGVVYQGVYPLGEIVTLKEHARLYTGVIVYSLPPDRGLPQRKTLSRGYHTIAGKTFTNEGAATYLIDCHDGFPHIVKQSQII